MAEADTPLLVLDLECTCERNYEGLPPEAMEIIEIGAVWWLAPGELGERFSACVRPIERPRLTDFCRQLTGIGQHEVDAAPLLGEVFAQFAGFAALHEARVWASWGGFDLRQIERECARKAVANPLEGWSHRNLRREFAATRADGRQIGLRQALASRGLAFEGRLHRALDDAVNTARLL